MYPFVRWKPERKNIPLYAEQVSAFRVQNGHFLVIPLSFGAYHGQGQVGQGLEQPGMVHMAER